MTFAGGFGLIVGIGMIGWWAFLIFTGQVPEFRTEPYRIAFHLAGELATALMLVVGGVALLADAGWGRSVYLVAAGMLLYTVIVSPGYFAQQRKWPMVAMFAVLLVLAVVSVLGVG